MNGIGSIYAITDFDGNVAERYDYSTYGVTQIYEPDGIMERVISSIDNPYTFHARRHDSETETDNSSAVMYYRYRMYSPDFQRFLQVNISGREAYSFCRNNPVNRVDSLGLNNEKKLTEEEWAKKMSEVAGLSNIPFVGDAIEVIATLIKGIISGDDVKEILMNTALAALPVALGSVIKVGKHAARSVDDYSSEAGIKTLKDLPKGWKRGQHFSALTAGSKMPTWSSIRRRYWISVAYNIENCPNLKALKNSGDWDECLFTTENIARMRKGLAPLDSEQVSYHLHHTVSREGLNIFRFKPVTRKKHYEIHKHLRGEIGR